MYVCVYVCTYVCVCVCVKVLCATEKTLANTCQPRVFLSGKVKQVATRTCHGVPANPGKLRVADGGVAVVAGDHDAVAIEASEVALVQCDALSSLEKDGRNTIERPVAATGDPVWVHVRVGSLGEREALDGYVGDWAELRRGEVEEHLDLRHHKDRARGRRTSPVVKEVELLAVTIEEELVRVVKLVVGAT
jgi:hypothetical protein